MAEPDPGKLDRIFGQAVALRTHGRPGLVMQSRFPKETSHRHKTAFGYTVFQGHDLIFDDFEGWLRRTAASTVHGRIFHPKRAEFANGASQVRGGLTANPYLRDYDLPAFLRNLIWNTRGERQFFMYGPEDGLKAWELIVQDPNAHVSVVTGAWAIDLMRSDEPFEDVRARAANLQKLEEQQLAILSGPLTKANVQVHSLSDYFVSPMEPLQSILDASVAPPHSYLGEAPRMRRMNGLEGFLQRLRNSGMQPHMAGYFGTAASSIGQSAEPEAEAQKLAN